MDSDKHARGIKCSLSLYLLQNQENKPVIPEGIMGGFSWLFPTLPDTHCDILGSNLGPLQHPCTGNLLSPGTGRFQGVSGWKVHLMVGILVRSWLNLSWMLRHHLSVRPKMGPDCQDAPAEA